MGDGMLSQAEIDALLGGDSSSSEPDYSSGSAPGPILESLTDEQKDILGEIGNISMGTSATTLFTLLSQKVNITTPIVTTMTWQQLSEGYDRPCVGIRVDYKEGLLGSNILILKERDVKIIANLMMGGDGSNVDGELTEIDLSAIGEAMNQMVGSSSTSLSSMIKKKIDILSPHAFILDFNDDDFFDNIGFGKDGIVATKFRMEIGNLIDSEIMQILPVDFAIEMVNSLISDSSYDLPEPVVAPEPKPQAQAPQMTPDMYQQPQVQAPQMTPDMYQQPQVQMPQMTPGMYQQPQMMPPEYQQQQPYYPQQPMMPQAQMPSVPQAQIPQFTPPPQVIQPAQFQPFDYSSVYQQKENMGIVMDVPLEVTVELGRTQKLIREILEFAPGTIIELDKLSGEPIDVYVNGKFVAKGEVVVIDENFGIRISDIVTIENRI